MLSRHNIHFILCWMFILSGASYGIVKPAWRLDLKETTSINGSIVKLKDLARNPLPEGLGNMVIISGGQPGTVRSVSHKMILRKLVTEGMAGGVSFTGSQWANVEFFGDQSSSEELRPQIRALIQPLVPTGKQGAPSTWFELKLPATTFSLNNEPTLTYPDGKQLVPGRNTLRIRLHDGAVHRDFQVIVILHVSDEIATAVVDLSAGTCLRMEDFTWQWHDLADIDQGVVVGRERLRACSTSKKIKPGHVLRESDLKITPVILAGDRVDLCIKRGSLEVVVKGEARQAGSLGQVIPVRNILNGRLVNATVSGPGTVQWRN